MTRKSNFYKMKLTWFVSALGDIAYTTPGGVRTTISTKNVYSYIAYMYRMNFIQDLGFTSFDWVYSHNKQNQ